MNFDSFLKNIRSKMHSTRRVTRTTQSSSSIPVRQSGIAQARTTVHSSTSKSSEGSLGTGQSSVEITSSNRENNRDSVEPTITGYTQSVYTSSSRTLDDNQMIEKGSMELESSQRSSANMMQAGMRRQTGGYADSNKAHAQGSMYQSSVQDGDMMIISEESLPLDDGLTKTSSSRSTYASRSRSDNKDDGMVIISEESLPLNKVSNKRSVQSSRGSSTYSSRSRLDNKDGDMTIISEESLPLNEEFTKRSLQSSRGSRVTNSSSAHARNTVYTSRSDNKGGQITTVERSFGIEGSNNGSNKDIAESVSGSTKDSGYSDSTQDLLSQDSETESYSEAKITKSVSFDELSGSNTQLWVQPQRGFSIDLEAEIGEDEDVLKEELLRIFERERSTLEHYFKHKMENLLQGFRHRQIEVEEATRAERSELEHDIAHERAEMQTTFAEEIAKLTRTFNEERAELEAYYKEQIRDLRDQFGRDQREMNERLAREKVEVQERMEVEYQAMLRTEIAENKNSGRKELSDREEQHSRERLQMERKFQVELTEVETQMQKLKNGMESTFTQEKIRIEEEYRIRILDLETRLRNEQEKRSDLEKILDQEKANTTNIEYTRKKESEQLKSELESLRIELDNKNRSSIELKKIEEELRVKGKDGLSGKLREDFERTLEEHKRNLERSYQQEKDTLQINLEQQLKSERKRIEDEMNAEKEKMKMENAKERDELDKTMKRFADEKVQSQEQVTKGRPGSQSQGGDTFAYRVEGNISYENQRPSEDRKISEERVSYSSGDDTRQRSYNSYPTEKTTQNQRQIDERRNVISEGDVTTWHTNFHDYPNEKEICGNQERMAVHENVSYTGGHYTGGYVNYNDYTAEERAPNGSQKRNDVQKDDRRWADSDTVQQTRGTYRDEHTMQRKDDTKDRYPQQQHHHHQQQQQKQHQQHHHQKQDDQRRYSSTDVRQDVSYSSHEIQGVSGPERRDVSQEDSRRQQSSNHYYVSAENENALRTDINELRRENEGLKAKIRAMEENINLHKTYKTEAKEEISRLQKAKDELKDELKSRSETEQEAKLAKEKAVKLEKRIKESEEKIKELENKIKELMEKLSDAEKKTKSEERKASELAKQLKKEKIKVTESARKIYEVETKATKTERVSSTVGSRDNYAGTSRREDTVKRSDDEAVCQESRDVKNYDSMPERSTYEESKVTVDTDYDHTGYSMSDRSAFQEREGKTEPTGRTNSVDKYTVTKNHTTRSGTESPKVHDSHSHGRERTTSKDDRPAHSHKKQDYSLGEDSPDVYSSQSYKKQDYSLDSRPAQSHKKQDYSMGDDSTNVYNSQGYKTQSYGLDTRSTHSPKRQDYGVDTRSTNAGKTTTFSSYNDTKDYSVYGKYNSLESGLDRIGGSSGKTNDLTRSDRFSNYGSVLSGSHKVELTKKKPDWQQRGGKQDLDVLAAEKKSKYEKTLAERNKLLQLIKELQQRVKKLEEESIRISNEDRIAQTYSTTSGTTKLDTTGYSTVGHSHENASLKAMIEELQQRLRDLLDALQQEKVSSLETEASTGHTHYIRDIEGLQHRLQHTGDVIQGSHGNLDPDALRRIEKEISAIGQFIRSHMSIEDGYGQLSTRTDLSSRADQFNRTDQFDRSGDEAMRILHLQMEKQELEMKLAMAKEAMSDYVHQLNDKIEDLQGSSSGGLSETTVRELYERNAKLKQTLQSLEEGQIKSQYQNEQLRKQTSEMQSLIGRMTQDMKGYPPQHTVTGETGDGYYTMTSQFQYNIPDVEMSDRFCSQGDWVTGSDRVSAMEPRMESTVNSRYSGHPA